LWSLTGPRGVEFTSVRFDRSDSVYSSNTSVVQPGFELLAGDYTLTVAGFEDAVGAFDFALRNLSDPAQSTLIADPVVGTPTTITDSQSDASETRVYRFNATAGDQFSFDANPTGSIASDYRLLDAFGRQVFTRGLASDQATVTVGLTGTYYLLIEGRLTNADPDAISLTITNEGNLPVPAFSGTALTLGGLTTGNLNTASQVDAYTFTLANRSLLNFDSLTNNASIRWRLTGPRGVEFDNVRFDRSDSIDTPNGALGGGTLVAGDYQLEVFASSGTPGAYSFRLNDLADATAITFGTDVVSQLATGNESQLYKFTANAGERYIVDFKSVSDVNNTEYKLVDPFGRTVFESNRLNDQDDFTIPFDGTYALIVEGYRTNSGPDDFTFTVNPVVEATAPLTFNQTTDANISTAGEQLVYDFSRTDESLLYFNPESSNSAVSWRVVNAEGYEFAGDTYNNGVEFVRLPAGSYRLIVDGDGGYVGDARFAAFAVDASSSALATDGSLTSAVLDNQNGLQLYTFQGQTGDHFALTPDYNMQFTTSDIASETAMKFVASADPEDGYSGINMALRADVFREGAAVNYIVVTDEDRDVEEDGVTFESLFRNLSDQNALVNMVTTSQFRDGSNQRAIGVDSLGNAYIADGVGGFTVGTGGTTTQNNVSVRQDYIDFAWALGGANWDLNLLRAGGVSAESFTNAFVDVKVDEILAQTSLQLFASNPNADLEILAPATGSYDTIIAGQQYDFDIRLGNDGQPISYDLLFSQGQTVGSIPVYIIAPYEYGATAVDADGDVLSWSIVDGPDGLVIDSTTGLLAWPEDSVVYGEHEITIRVDDGRGGFDEQTFTLNVNGGEPASISGNVYNFGLLQTSTVDVIVEGTSDPYLAGMPDGSTASSGDVAPDHSPALVEGLLLQGGQTLTFSASGQVSFGGLPNPNETPDGKLSGGGTHGNGAENGISNASMNFNSLVGVFLTDAQPNTNVAPDALNFTPSGNVVGGINYTELSPELQQVFFIGDGVTDDGTVQEITVPDGATRLYLGTWDGFGWYNNGGFFDVQVTGQFYAPPTAVENTVYLDQNRNGLFDVGEQSTTVDVLGQYSFENLDSGAYVVSLLPIEGWQQILPESGQPIEVSLEAGEDKKNVVFGVREVPVVNTNPEIISEPLASIVAGEFYEYKPTISELDGDSLEFDLPLAPAGMVVSPLTGTVRWTPTTDQIGIQNVLLRVRDGRGGYDLQYYQIGVLAPNTAPVFVSTPVTGPAGVGLPFTYNAEADDADGDTLTYSLSASPAGASIDSATGQVDWTPSINDLGTASFTIVADDGRGLTTEQSFDVAVELNPTNIAPEFGSVPPTDARLGDTYLYQVRVSDQNGDPLTLTLDAVPAGMTLSPDGLISWEPSVSQLGEQTVRLIVDDGRGGTATQEFTIDVATQPVNNPPIIVSEPLSSAVVDINYQFSPVAEDANNDTLFWQLVEGPRGMTIDSATGQVNWSPTIEDLGTVRVTIEVFDTHLVGTGLTYDLNVRAVNTPPIILSSPPTSAAIGATYLYQVAAQDPDQDPLSFSLDTAPSGMTIDAETGRITWSPTAGQDGPQDVAVTVTDSAGASITQSYTIQVATGVSNQLPTITSAANFYATVGQSYTYDVEADDPDGDDLTYALLSAPSGMTIDSQTGLIEWTPAAGDVGSSLVEVLVTDPSGGGSLQGFGLQVLAENNAPVITSAAPTDPLSAGETFRYDLLATDADGDFLTYELVNGPDGMVIDGLGRMFWIPTTDQFGTSSVEVTVTDTRGATATQSFDLVVEQDTEAPQAVILVSQNPVNVGEMIDIRVSAIDNVGVNSIVLTLDGEVLPLDSNGAARVEMATVGGIVAEATVTDSEGNQTVEQITIFVSDPNDVNGPTLLISSPTDGGVITAPTDVIGTVNDDTLVSYRLLLADATTRDFRVIAEGAENVDDDVLGQIDPTLLENGSYVLRLEAFDASGNGTVIEQAVEINT
ncbi:MAG: putative Ig domain-containing protein, partial [Planctomycetota bacterium]